MPPPNSQVMDSEVPPFPAQTVIAERTLGVAASIALSAVFYGVTVTVAVAVELIKWVAGLPVDLFTSLLIQQLAAWPITLGIALYWMRAPCSEVTRLRPFSARLVPALLLASFGATPLLLETTTLVPVPELFRRAFELMARQMADSSRVTLFLPIVVVAPVAEELFFRGVVLHGFMRRYGATKAVWGSALLFALFHLNPWQAMLALPLGLGLAWLTLRTGSLGPAILGHAMVNFTRNFLLDPVAVALGYPAGQLWKMDHLPRSLLIVGAVAVVAGGWLLGRQVSRLPR